MGSATERNCYQLYTQDRDVLFVLAAGGVLKKGLARDSLKWPGFSFPVARNHVQRLVRQGLLSLSYVNNIGWVRHGPGWALTDKGREAAAKVQYDPKESWFEN